ncbi:MAG: type I 3-dehydroquinate dehydratase, partial [Gemmiger sp.]
MKIIVPIMAATPAEAAAQAAALAQNPHADWVELRLDSLSGGYAAALRAVRQAVGGKTLLVTIRTKQEGGLADLTPSAYAGACRELLATGGVDILDIEKSVGPWADVLIDEARAAGALALCSCHHFEGTPPVGQMVETLTSMRRADIAKLAVMPHTRADVLALLQV